MATRRQVLLASAAAALARGAFAQSRKVPRIGILHSGSSKESPSIQREPFERGLRELGWHPLVSFEEGVGRMLANIDYWRQAPVWDPDSIAGATKNWFAFLEGKTA